MRLRDLIEIVGEDPERKIEYLVMEYDDDAGIQKMVIGIRQDPAGSPDPGQEIIRLVDDEPASGAGATPAMGM